MRFPPPTTTTKTDDWSTIDKTHTRKAQFHCRILTLYDLIFWLTYCSLLITLINYQLRKLRVIARSLTFNAAVSLVHAFVFSRLDYCSSIFAGHPEVRMEKLRRVNRAAARIIGGFKKIDQ